MEPCHRAWLSGYEDSFVPGPVAILRFDPSCVVKLDVIHELFVLADKVSVSSKLRREKQNVVSVDRLSDQVNFANFLWVVFFGVEPDELPACLEPDSSILVHLFERRGNLVSEIGFGPGLFVGTDNGNLNFRILSPDSRQHLIAIRVHSENGYLLRPAAVEVIFQTLVVFDAAHEGNVRFFLDIFHFRHNRVAFCGYETGVIFLAD